MVDALINRIYQLAASGKYGSNRTLDRTIDSFLAAKAKNASEAVLCRILEKGIQQLRQMRSVEKRAMRF